MRYGLNQYVPPPQPMRGIKWSNNVTGNNLPRRFNGKNGNQYTGQDLKNLQRAEKSAPKRLKSFSYKRKRNFMLNPEELQLFTNIWTAHNDFNDMEDKIDSLNIDMATKQRLMGELMFRTRNAPAKNTYIVASKNNNNQQK